MSQNKVLIVIAGFLCFLCLLWAFIRQPMHSLFFVVRGIFFILLLYAVQLCVTALGWEHVVTVNIVTSLISAFLGVPGILVLYGICLLL